MEDEIQAMLNLGLSPNVAKDLVLAGFQAENIKSFVGFCHTTGLDLYGMLMSVRSYFIEIPPLVDNLSKIRSSGNE